MRSKHPPLRGVADARPAGWPVRATPGPARHKRQRSARAGGELRPKQWPRREVPGPLRGAEAEVGPLTHRGPRAPSTYARTGTRPGGVKPGRSPPPQGVGLTQARGACYGWRAPSRRQRRRTGKRAAPGADPRATFVERAQRAEPARRPAARVGRGRPAGRGVRAAAVRQQGAPLPCAG